MRLKRAIVASICLVVLLLVGQVLAGPFAYSIPVQEDQITIGADGTVELVRYFEFAVASSSSDKGTEIWAGLPTGATQVQSVVDESGKKVNFSTRSSGGQYVVVLKGFSAISPGSKLGFTITARIPNFLYADQSSADYATMEYTPAWWDQGDVGTRAEVTDDLARGPFGIIVPTVLSTLAWRVTRAGQMVTQYYWLYERAGAFNWRPKTSA